MPLRLKEGFTYSSHDAVATYEGLARVAGGVVALSPDGERLALILRGADGKERLHTRLL